MSNAITTYSPFWKTYAIVLLLLGLIALWWFIVRYMLKVRWWLAEESAHLFHFTLVLALFYTFYVVRLVLPDFDAAGVLRLVLLTYLTGVAIWRTVLFERTYRVLAQRGRRRDTRSTSER